MLEDRQVLRDVWDGRLPVCFRLADNEVHTVSAPDPFYMLIPRMTYFPLVIDKVRRHFSQSVHPDHAKSDVWLEWGDMPLQWHYPVGLQFDLLATDSVLPWNLVVHFTDRPDQCPFMKREAMESFFFSTVKEADQLKHKGSAISSLGKRDHSQLWTGLAFDKFDQFWAVNRHLMECEGESAFRAVPVRLYRAGAPYVQRPVPVRAEDGRQNTLRQLITQLAPDLTDDARAIIHGIEPPMDTPLQWLSQHFSYADNFLHIVVFP
ncbi:autophagy protein 5-like [Amphibalanus amphitrite]|uniref:autophagy protein 5-like n=1 Tax=Amphibalanus amphitrite TaxID=1232801 RepID=UPI001C91E763|nr:autophagy protein 5-like [Amphibalanus amphitrite]XP_043193568.1 autophagy protein 5-like [Amphibalanus amphitrite]XP_043193569.1 autophagy protein 5-like [Amphibalanus amphitrite]XP_043193570.1 autophagy protein 5-like [Amphibalanus amphitrite]XP_043193571.1 autophagy protein 5-like [Amphibalanus amphitrite]XP_043193572.1 autophagy protein 5-like [Amphibalanus amphitrite]XP_043193573.1 autophagy protein 5-like [Amphibalanus amphitrite]XP_043193574.1 autophagy protein 5-like [Amphibalanus